MALSKLYNMETVLIILSVVNVFILIAIVQTYSRIKQLGRKIENNNKPTNFQESIKGLKEAINTLNYEKN